MSAAAWLLSWFHTNDRGCRGISLLHLSVIFAPWLSLAVSANLSQASSLGSPFATTALALASTGVAAFFFATQTTIMILKL